MAFAQEVLGSARSGGGRPPGRRPASLPRASLRLRSCLPARSARKFRNHRTGEQADPQAQDLVAEAGTPPVAVGRAAPPGGVGPGAAADDATGGARL